MSLASLTKIPLQVITTGSANLCAAAQVAGPGIVTGTITQHRLRLQLSLELLPPRNLPAPPIVCQMLDIAKVEAACIHIGDHGLLLAAWPLITERIAHKATAQCADKRYELPPMPAEG
jgi:hypothetical protein